VRDIVDAHISTTITSDISNSASNSERISAMIVHPPRPTTVSCGTQTQWGNFAVEVWSFVIQQKYQSCNSWKCINYYFSFEILFLLLYMLDQLNPVPRMTMVIRHCRTLLCPAVSHTKWALWTPMV
jgi:hypothetical protein